MTLDRSTSAFLEELAAIDPSLANPRGLPELRSLAGKLSELNGPGPDMEAVDDVVLARDGTMPLRLRVLVPRPQPTGVVVYFHGPAWGWVAGSLDTADTVCRKLAERSGAVFVVVDYRKAPEHPYPSAVEDASAALLWAERYRQGLAGDVGALIVAGEGSGAALAVVAARRAREACGPDVGLAILICPVLSDEVTPQAAFVAGGTLLSPVLFEEVWTLYAPNVTDRRSRDAAPLHETDYTTHPPTLLLSAEHDLLAEQSETYRKRLDEAGVPVRHEWFPGQMHGFFGILALPLGERAFQAVVRAIRSYSARGSAVTAA